MAMLGLVAFFMATIMNFNQQIKVKMESFITRYPSKSL
jgi:biopolymer transport protein ExbD